MTHQVTTIAAFKPLCKEFNKATGRFNTYPTAVAKVTTNNHPVTSPDDLLTVLNNAGKANQAITLGQPKRTLENERRKGMYEKDQLLSLFVIDIDKLDTTLPNFIALLPEEFRTTQAVWQPSASMHLQPDPTKSGYKLSGHLFYLLDQPTSKQIMTMFAQNLNITTFKDKISLSPTKLFLSWPVDVSIYQPSRLMYVAPPVNSPNPDHPETQNQILNPEGTPLLHTTAITKDVPVKSILMEHAREIISDLRSKEGFKPLKKNAIINGIGCAASTIDEPEPGLCHIVEEDDTYVRLNLNDGDSGAYYVFKYNPEFIHNFKGEPSIPTKKFDPDFYEGILSRYTHNDTYIKQALDEDPNNYSILGPLYQPDDDKTITFPFVDRKRDQDCIASFKTDTNELLITTHGNEKRITAILNDANRPHIEKDQFPMWDTSFDPAQHPFKPIDFPSKSINTFSPPPLYTAYLHKFIDREAKQAKPIQTDNQYADISVNMFSYELSKLCPLHHHIIFNGVGGNPEDRTLQDARPHIETNYFINWMAYILQTRRKTQVAWLLQGTSKTGKSSIIQHILIPIVGTTHALLQEYSGIMSQYTGWLEKLMFAGLDEVKAEGSSQMEAQQKIKHEITESRLNLQEKYVKLQQNVDSFTNFIFCTNFNDAIKMDDGEAMRFSVGEWQSISLKTQEPFNRNDFDFHGSLEKERELFLSFLLQLNTSQHMATNALDNSAKRLMQEGAMSHHAKFAQRVNHGDTYWLFTMLPTRQEITGNPTMPPHVVKQNLTILEECQRILLDWMKHSTEEPNWVARQDVYKFYLMSDHENQKQPSSRAFNQMIGHYNLVKNERKQKVRSDLHNSPQWVFARKIQFNKLDLHQVAEIKTACQDIITKENDPVQLTAVAMADQAMAQGE